ncbi:hypothetical protein CMI47_13635 [Candidatus Pacearchaeota archaeon]|nr:hypothetical protein [Candidatus Pacearchaeota archaeon]
MPVKIPVRGDYDASGTPTGLSEFQSGEYVSAPFGGTGQNTYSSGEILVGNASGSLTRNKIQGQAGQVVVTSGDGTITISLDSSLGLGIATQNNLGTVKVPTSGGLEVDAQGNLKIAPMIDASSGISDFTTEVNLEVVKAIDVDESGRVKEIKRELIAIKDGVALVEDAEGNAVLQSDGLAVAMSIVFGG